MERKNNMLDAFKAFLKTEEGKNMLVEIAEETYRMEEVKNKQIERFHNLTVIEREHFIEKTIKKYNSQKYKDKWYKKGIIPPESLYELFFEYGKRYGVPQETDNDFSGGKYVFDNKWVVEIMYGQGTVISIWNI